MRALVVDDIRSNRALPVMLMRKLGWEVLEAEDGEAALHLLMTQKFDIVLMDISMPKMDGHHVCRKIRESENQNKHTHMIAYTAHAMSSEIAEFKAYGFNLVLVKPVNLDALRAALRIET